MQRVVLPQSRRRELVAIAAILCLAATLRLVNLAADPPYWTGSSPITDEGWWADAARGKFLFDDYFADDFGTAYLVTPGYTHIARLFFEIFGVSLTPLRVLPAIAGVLAVALVYIFLRDVRPPPLRLAGPLMLAICPLWWAYGRLGLLEETQATLLLATFVLVLCRGRRSLVPGAFAGGLLLGLAIAVKPNAVLLGGVPILTAATVDALLPADGGKPGITVVKRVAGITLGVLVPIILFFGPVLLSHPHQLLGMVASEAEISEYAWIDRLVIPNLFGSTETLQDGKGPIPWILSSRAPVLLWSFWFALLPFFTIARGSGPLLRTFEHDATARKTIGSLVWASMVFLFVSASPRQPAHRWLLLLPALALSSPLLAAKARQLVGLMRRTEPSPRAAVRSALAWLWCLMPLVVYSKPHAVLSVMRLGADVPIGDSLGLGYPSASILFLLLSVILAAILGLLVPDLPSRFVQLLWLRRFGRRLSLSVLGLILALNLAHILSYHMTPSFGLRDTVGAFSSIPNPGDIVLGHAASTLFFASPARTVRRSRPEDLSPPPNPDVWFRLRPHYIVDHTVFDYQQSSGYYDDLIAAHGYRPVASGTVGPALNGEPRYRFVLYESR